MREKVLITMLLISTLMFTDVVVAKEKATQSTDFIQFSSQSEDTTENSSGTDTFGSTIEGNAIEYTDSSSTMTEESQSKEIPEISLEAFPSDKSRSDLYEVIQPPVQRSGRAASLTLPDIAHNNSNTPTKDFIDISSHNGLISVSDYQFMKNNGVKSVVVKLTEYTTYRNPYAASQIANAQAAGLNVHAYHYSWFTTSAEATKEADYFAKYATELKLPKSAIMVNDIEEPKIKDNKNHTQNSQAFADRLRQLGYSNVQHYIGLNWINEGRINAKTLGEKNVWVAAYPYNPTKTQLYTAYGAWQWTSRVFYPGITNPFDMSSDYANKFSNVQPQGPYISLNQYLTVTKSNSSIWQNFSWKISGNTTNFINKTLLAKGKYNHSNGKTYYSVYDNKDVWQGYVESNVGVLSSESSGVWQSYGKYVTVTGNGYNTWSDFSWRLRNPSEKIIGKKLLAKGRYHHFNGASYLSLYDSNGKWQGYINSRACSTDITQQGPAVRENFYVTINKKNYSIWQNFSWKQLRSSNQVLNTTFNVKISYKHSNGSHYYSLYDSKGKWYGYINSTGTEKAAGAEGIYIRNGSKVQIKSKNYNLWSNFSWKKRHSSSQFLNESFVARGQYNHINGAIYYSVYSTSGKWYGYINANACRIIN